MLMTLALASASLHITKNVPPLRVPISRSAFGRNFCTSVANSRSSARTWIGVTPRYRKTRSSTDSAVSQCPLGEALTQNFRRDNAVPAFLTAIIFAALHVGHSLKIQKH